MKGILIEPGRAPEPANLPDTLSAMEARLGGTVELYTVPRFRIELSVPKEAVRK